MMAAKECAEEMGIKAACELFEVSRASFYRFEKPGQPKPSRSKPPRALSDEERQKVLEICYSERFIDRAPAEIYATLLDEGEYICSPRTMYRIINDAHEIKERRNQARHPVYSKPELCAKQPNQVWSWDITDLKGPCKGKRFKLYVTMDLYSRAAVGWTVQEREDENIAKEFHRQTFLQQGIEPYELTLHSDRGAAMISKTVGALLSDLHVSKSHSRPRVSNDNPYSESLFKTMKYGPKFPERFGSIEDARSFCRVFFDWYNKRHRHSGIGMLTPASVHEGRTEEILIARQKVLEMAHKLHPERFSRGCPKPFKLPEPAWINPPKKEKAA